MIDISKLKVPLAIVGTLMSAAAGAGGMYAGTKAHLEENAKEVAAARADAQKAQQAAERAQADVHSHDISIAVIQTEITAMKDSLERIERAVVKK